MKEREACQPERAENQDELRRDHDALAIVAIGNLPADQRQNDQRDDLDQPDNPQRQRRARAFVELPADSEGKHLAAKRRDQSANQ